MSLNVPDHDLKLEADELLQAAIMGETLIIIVEGYDDIAIYERLAKSAGIDCEIFASENILTKIEGCSGVIKNYEIIEVSAPTIKIDKYVLGIIDRDSRFYRGEMPQKDGILVLNYYSIESHFVNSEVMHEIITSITNATDTLCSTSDAIKIFERIKIRLGYLYYLSLEALRNACEPEYSSLAGYGDKVRALIGKSIPEAVTSKSSELDLFAAQFEITNQWEDLLLVCKGKWLLEMFLVEVISEIKELPANCRNGVITKCQYCIGQVVEKCLYKTGANYEWTHLSILCTKTAPSSLDYIVSRMRSLGYTQA